MDRYICIYMGKDISLSEFIDDSALIFWHGRISSLIIFVSQFSEQESNKEWVELYLFISFFCCRCQMHRWARSFTYISEILCTKSNTNGLRCKIFKAPLFEDTSWQNLRGLPPARLLAHPDIPRALLQACAHAVPLSAFLTYSSTTSRTGF